MEVVDLEFNDLEPIQLRMDDSRPSVTFGAEFLMNNTRKSAGSSSNMNIDLGELDKLESDLNELGGQSKKNSDSRSFFNFMAAPFGSATEHPSGNIRVEELDVGLGQATSNTFSEYTKGFDGFSKVNEIPVQQQSQSMSDRDRRRKKLMMIKRLEEWGEKGIIKYSGNSFHADSPYDDIEDEYESALEDKRRKDTIKLYGTYFKTFIDSAEYLNSTFDPFDLNLDGLGEQVAENIDDYDDIFTELHEKYKGVKLAPELALIMRIGFAAAVVNFTNKALSSATPGFQDIIKQSPELMKTFTQATVQLMSQKSPEFSFAANMLNKEPENNTSFGPPPSAVSTKIQLPSQRGPPMQSRPDIAVGRGMTTPMFREQGVDITNTADDLVMQQRTIRPEMPGPRNIDMNNILSGLKQTPQQSQAEPVENNSVISITSMNELMSNNTRMPSKKGNRRKPNSERNTISLDI